VRTLKSQPDGIVTRLMPADTVRIVGELQKRGFTKKERIHNHQIVDTPELYSMSAEAGNVMDAIERGHAREALGQAADGEKNLAGAPAVAGGNVR
jgi:hypothetical protein